MQTEEDTSHKEKRNLKKKKSLRKQRALELKESDQFWEEVWEMMENGANPLDIATAYDIPKMSIYNWVRRDPEKAVKAEMYALNRGDMQADEIGSISRIEKLQRVMDKQIQQEKPNPALGRLIMDMRTWYAKVSNPDKYGDKKQVQVTQSTRVEHVNQLREMSKKKLKDITPPRKEIPHEEKLPEAD
ncbi:terminase small subunit [uncultured Mediterranean phage uvMED]|nr:terminase small subunit [uncultured Mediterranean phage uvMED]